MINYYTDSAQKSLWVLSQEGFLSTKNHDEMLTCFSAEDDSGYHVGQQIYDPKLKNSNWQPLEGEILISDILAHV